MRRLLPEPAETTVADQLAALDLTSLAHDERPYVITNFVVSLDGRATLRGRSGELGSDTDTQLLVGLRTVVDALLIGAGTMRAERYGRIVPDPRKRAARERRGLPHDPLAALVSGRLDLPWDAELFTSGGGEVVVFTASADEAPQTRTAMEVVRHQPAVDLGEAMRHLRRERGVRALLCEGGPRLHAQLLEAGLVDELFVTIAAKVVGGDGPGLASGLSEADRPLELVWLLEEGGELFTRYRIGAGPAAS